MSPDRKSKRAKDLAIGDPIYMADGEPLEPPARVAYTVVSTDGTWALSERVLVVLGDRAATTFRLAEESPVYLATDEEIDAADAAAKGSALCEELGNLANLIVRYRLPVGAFAEFRAVLGSYADVEKWAHALGEPIRVRGFIPVVDATWDGLTIHVQGPANSAPAPADETADGDES